MAELCHRGKHGGAGAHGVKQTVKQQRQNHGGKPLLQESSRGFAADGKKQRAADEKKQRRGGCAEDAAYGSGHIHLTPYGEHKTRRLGHMQQDHEEGSEYPEYIRPDHAHPGDRCRRTGGSMPEWGFRRGSRGICRSFSQRRQKGCQKAEQEQQKPQRIRLFFYRREGYGIGRNGIADRDIFQSKAVMKAYPRIAPMPRRKGENGLGRAWRQIPCGHPEPVKEKTAGAVEKFYIRRVRDGLGKAQHHLTGIPVKGKDKAGLRAGGGIAPTVHREIRDLHGSQGERFFRIPCTPAYGIKRNRAL